MTSTYCPGWYCGRRYLENGELSECGACPRGFRRNETTFICEPCQDNPLFYDWLYLGFMVLLVIVLHWFFIDMVAKGKRCCHFGELLKAFNNAFRSRSCCKDMLILHFTALMEVVVSSVAAILLSSPVSEFKVRSCRAHTLADWYTMLHNPTPNYEKKIYCTQEAVYPLYVVLLDLSFNRNCRIIFTGTQLFLFFMLLLWA